MDRHRHKELVINHVKNIGAIWDKSHPHHHNVHILSKHWRHVAEKVGKPEKEVKTIWKNLRQEFGKQWRKCTCSGDAAPDEELVSNWPFYAAMDFLTDQFKPREMTGNMGKNVEINQDAETPISDEEGDNMASAQTPAPSPPMSPEIASPVPTRPQSNSSASSSGFRQRKTTQSVIGDGLISIEKEKLDLRRTKLTEPDDDNIQFLKSLAPQMRQLDPQRNLLFRTEMQSRLYTLLYNDVPQRTLPQQPH